MTYGLVRRSPRMGERVRTREGAFGEVFAIIRGVDAIRAKSEVDVHLLNSRMRIVFGPEWPDHYYEATIWTEDGKLLVVLPDQVVAIEPAA